MEKIGRKRLLYKIRSLVFLSQNLTSGKKSYLWQWPLSDDLQGEWNTLFKYFQDFQVFYKEIYFAITVCRDILIQKKHEHDNHQSHMYKNVPLEHGFFYFNNKMDFGTIRIKTLNDCLIFFVFNQFFLRQKIC